MVKCDWTSKKRYRVDEKTGNIGYIARQDKYVLLTTANVYAIDQEFAKKCFDVENRIDGTIGRPSLFPGEKINAKLITLPVRLWEKIGEPASVRLAEIINEH